MSNADEIINELRQLGNKRIAGHSQRFFKTGKGQYGEGDEFLGIRVPVLRKMARKYRDTNISQIALLLKSRFHEERLLSLFMLVDIFRKAGDETKKILFEFYLNNTKQINNWDLVDSSAEYIVGAYLQGQDRKTLYDLARSSNLWERRISIMSTFYFIKNNEFDDSLRISEILLDDKEDLIHKAAGWMLREVGKRDISVEEDFLKMHYKKMPRTMLRYAIEKFPDEKRRYYLRQGKRNRLGLTADTRSVP